MLSLWGKSLLKETFDFYAQVLTCNACKMFFRRIEVEKITYKCKYKDRCHLDENVLGIKIDS